MNHWPGGIMGLERVKGIEPSSQAWEAHVLPLNHTRILNEGIVYQEARQNARTSPGSQTGPRPAVDGGPGFNVGRRGNSSKFFDVAMDAKALGSVAHGN